MRRLCTCAIGVAILLVAVSPAGQTAGAESAGPSCAEGPTAIDGTIVGTPCDDTIVAPPGVQAVNGGGGDDTIVPAPIAAVESCPVGCHLDIGSQTFEGGPGDDVVYGERGNDRLYGGEGNDQLFGGIGDDLLKGGPGNDRLAGGFGADSIDGEEGDDYIRGDATIDTIVDRGGGVDTLSFSTGVTPGFPNNPGQGYPDFSAFPGFPGTGGERGVYLDLSGTVGDNGVAPFGGGVDSVEQGEFEVILGTPFSDYIVGSGDDETIFGGGGGDVILGAGGDDSLYGGADGDHLDGGSGSNAVDGEAGSDHCANPSPGTACEVANTGGVVLRDPSKIGTGLTAPGVAATTQLYLSGSSAVDKVTATYAPGPPASVTFSLEAGSAPFDTSASASAGCNPPGSSQLVCPLSGSLDSIVVAGLGGDDVLQASSFPSSVSVVLLGGEGDDSLTGGDQSEDVIVDGPDSGGPGEDTLSAGDGDDALLNNGGEDTLSGDQGNDLFLSDSLCDGDLLDGGGERDNASWAKFKASGVGARLDTGKAGRPGSGGVPECAGGSLDTLQAIEDLEGSASEDAFFGDAGDNQLLGWAGADIYSSGAGVDRILANSGDSDPVIACGDGNDTALIDRPPHLDVAAADCEIVREADPNNFRVETQLEAPVIPSPQDVQPSGGSGGHTTPKRRRPRACLASSKPGPLRCAVRPRNLRFGALGRLDRIRWQHWGSRRATGFGRLTILWGRRTPYARIRARIRAGRPESCDSRRWYTRLTVTYGRGYREAFVRHAISETPCG